jgi:hypothetical protein
MALVDDARIKSNMDLHRGWGFDDLDTVKDLLCSRRCRRKQAAERNDSAQQDRPHGTTQLARIISRQRRPLDGKFAQVEAELMSPTASANDYGKL